MKGNALLTIAGAVTLTIGVSFLTTVVRGWVIAMLWGWFIVPLLMLPNLSVIEAMGLAIIVTYFTQHLDYQREQKPMDWSKAVGSFIGWNLFPLLLGWMVHELLLRGIGT